MKYTCILFDLDDTLLDFKAASRYALEKTFLHYEIPYKEPFIQQYYTINKQVWLAFENGDLPADQLRSERFRRFLKKTEHDHNPVEMGKMYLDHLKSTSFLVEDSKPLLDRLFPNKKLAVVTNGLKEVQRPRIRNAELTHYFDTIVVSDEIGVSKPHKAFFDHVFEQMDHPKKREVLMVGDSITSDIRGGIQYGIDTCWFNPQGTQNNSKFQPTIEISELSILEEFV